MSTDSATATPIDATIEVITPENISVHYRVAGPVRRVLALAIDLAVFFVILACGMFILGWLGWLAGTGLAIGIGAVFAFLLQWFFFGGQEALLNGRTLGKWILGLRVITIEGHPINALQAIMRSLLRLPDFAVPIVDLVTMSLNDRFQRLGDIVCGTVVIFEQRSWLFGVAKLDDPRAVQLAGFLPSDYEISKTLAKALATYVERRRFFSPPRRREVARHLAEPLLRKFNLPADTSNDLLLCALYYRAFIADRGDDEQQAATIAAETKNPFLLATSPVASPFYIGPTNPSAPNTVLGGYGYGPRYDSGQNSDGTSSPGIALPAGGSQTPR